jgi:hypothetical protein
VEVRDWVTLFSAIIIVVGWFVNSWLNRRHEISKKKLEHRLNALQSYMPFAFSLSSGGADPFKTDPQLIDKLKTVANYIKLYGTTEELKLMDELVNALEIRDIDRFKKAHSAFYDCVRTQLRNELGITK